MALKYFVTAQKFDADFQDFLAAGRSADLDVQAAAKAILDDVRSRGDAALFDYTRRFDRFELGADNIRFSSGEIAAARKACPPDQLAALAEASARIRAFHERQKPLGERFCDSAGVTLGHRWTALSCAGIYVPGGKASYPSSVLMNAIPASVAGVERVVMVVPTPDGIINPLVLAAAELAGVHEIYRVGGAQAVGALAYGTASIAPVDKITGPGNAYVAAAKREVFGIVGIDMIAGPSEILVVADNMNDPAWIAADLLSQAEHDEAAQSILITDDEAFADRVMAAVEVHMATLPRATIARASWDNHGAIFIVPNLDAAAALVDRIAPEHLELAVEDPEALMANIHHAGAIFLGRYTPEAIGDYVAGPNHVLPTSRSARFSSGLSVLDFMKRSTIIGCSPESLDRIGPAGVTLANAEGLEAHARSIAVRLGRRPNT